ncbi:hypothetical protein ACFFGV_05030 [Pontibacillus salicampi]|uniref:Uncharacterized protein n=1 Tax=Pontibacillus salicampi TaxID=1449801 RepID=A0ABV6LKP4_9BACI
MNKNIVRDGQLFMVIGLFSDASTVSTIVKGKSVLIATLAVLAYRHT